MPRRYRETLLAVRFVVACCSHDAYTSAKVVHARAAGEGVGAALRDRFGLRPFSHEQGQRDGMSVSPWMVKDVQSRDRGLTGNRTWRQSDERAPAGARERAG